jgi:peroxiredoxin
MDMSGVVALLWTAALLLIAVLVVMGLVLQQLVGSYGSALLRIEALEQAGGLAEPVDAPLFTLPDLEGELVSLEETLADGLPTMVVFVSPACHNCTDLLPDVAAWQRDDHGPHVLVLSDGTVADNRAKAAESGEIQILLQPDRSLGDEIGLLGTPAAILVGVDGRIAGGVVHGPDPIRSLFETTHNTLLGTTADHDHGPVHQIEGRPLGAGDEAPEVSLRSETGEPVTLDEVFAEDGTVAVFWRFDCGFCQGIVDQVKALEATTPIRLITESTVDDIRATGLTSPLVRDEGSALGNWLGVPGTPSAARLRAGVLDSSVAIGGPGVLDLLRASQRDDVLVD